MQILNAIVANPQVRIMVYLIAANVCVAIAAAIKRHTFTPLRVADWLVNHIVLYLLGYSGAAFLALAQPDLAWLQPAAFVSITTVFIGRIYVNLRDLGFVPTDSPPPSPLPANVVPISIAPKVELQPSASAAS